MIQRIVEGAAAGSTSHPAEYPRGEFLPCRGDGDHRIDLPAARVTIFAKQIRLADGAWKPVEHKAAGMISELRLNQFDDGGIGQQVGTGEHRFALFAKSRAAFDMRADCRAGGKCPPAEAQREFVCLCSLPAGGWPEEDHKAVGHGGSVTCQNPGGRRHQAESGQRRGCTTTSSRSSWPCCRR